MSCPCLVFVRIFWKIVSGVCLGSVSCPDSVRIFRKKCCPVSVCPDYRKKLPVVCLSGRTRTRQSCPDFHCPCPPTSDYDFGKPLSILSKSCSIWIAVYGYWIRFQSQIVNSHQILTFYRKSKIRKKSQKLILGGQFKYSLFSLMKNLITLMSHIYYHVSRYFMRRRNCKLSQLWFIFYEVIQVYILLCTGVILLCR